MSKTGFVYHPDFLKHLTGPGHPERPARLESIYNRVNSSEAARELKFILPKSIDAKWLAEVHSPEYLQRLKTACRLDSLTYLDPDTRICPDSYDIAVLAAGAVIDAIDSVQNNMVDNCFCAIRPPGHHAEKDHAKGFCLLNNIAIGAAYLKKRHGLGRICIIDWDVHHGNGTQHVFYDDPSVFYISLHQYPFYPGTGAAQETGEGKGKGYTLNIPMKVGTGNDDYLAVFRNKVVPSMENYDPEFILISAGFDAHYADPLGGMSLTDNGFYEMTLCVREAAAKYCNGKIVSILEGGYNLDALALSVSRHLEALSI